MSAHVEVVTADFRRHKIKVTPGTYLVDVLNEACQKHNLSSDKYLLKSVVSRNPFLIMSLTTSDTSKRSLILPFHFEHQDLHLVRSWN